MSSSSQCHPQRFPLQNKADWPVGAWVACEVVEQSCFGGMELWIVFVSLLFLKCEHSWSTVYFFVSHDGGAFSSCVIGVVVTGWAYRVGTHNRGCSLGFVIRMIKLLHDPI